MIRAYETEGHGIYWQVFEVSDIIGGHWVSKLYIGYTVREAKRRFKEEHYA